MEASEIVIVGGGLASARLVKGYRESGGDLPLRLISADSALPYHRPPLSKRYLRGETDDPPLVEQPDFYEKHRVDVSLRTLVTGLDTAARRLELEGEEQLPYEKLVLAGGARPRRPGVSGEDLEGVFVLRTLENSSLIRDRARGARRAVVVGAGFIGMEVTASLRALEVEVAQVHRGQGLFEVLGSAPLSAFLSQLYRDRGVDVLFGDELVEIRGNGVVSGAVTKSGRELDADLVVLGLGVDPWTDWLEGSGIELENGVVVNERFETSAPDVHAVGDLASFYDPVFGRRRRIEHWSNANYQGAELGKLLATGKGGYDNVSTFFSEVFGVSLKVFGASEQHDEQVYRGRFEDGKALGFYLLEGRLVATVQTGLDEETENQLKELLRKQPEVRNRDALADPDAPIAAAF